MMPPALPIPAPAWSRVIKDAEARGDLPHGTVADALGIGRVAAAAVPTYRVAGSWG
ncbi:MAG: hypothetical protein QJR12_07030 [Mycobacterium sp.]|uniref:hypothetical protein n=1 Tax=Mycobacterium sp. TaxID=1785 RepID=UPI0026044753|nr:hypothetical protein [Mycobacterium sp.]MDI3314027.1 hypothetical protein [Mycobacterium sp.]